MENLLKRFISYAKVDTQSDPTSKTVPSTETQINFAKSLKKELEEIGVKNVTLDENGHIQGELPSNISKDVPVIGFLAHMDTAQGVSGQNVNPQIHENYDGEDLILNKEKNIVLSSNEFKELNNYIGDTIITTDGTTLLGADDKAGVAEIITAVEYLINHPEIPHGKIKIAFTPDEEGGDGVSNFDIEKFGADFAYTVDGGEIGEIEYENFNAATAWVTVFGKSVHTGYAKGILKNAVTTAMEFNSMLPVNERPEYTEKYEGFYHLEYLNGTLEKAEMMYLLRDHDLEKLNKKMDTMKKVEELLNLKYGNGTVELKLKNSYYNMKEKVEPHMHIVDNAVEAMKMAEVTPRVSPIRGGTDGAALSQRGLPCPNLFTGGHNFHGRFEYIPLKSMEKAVEVILNIIKIYSK